MGCCDGLRDNDNPDQSKISGKERSRQIVYTSEVESTGLAHELNLGMNIKEKLMIIFFGISQMRKTRKTLPGKTEEIILGHIKIEMTIKDLEHEITWNFEKGIDQGMFGLEARLL